MQLKLVSVLALAALAVAITLPPPPAKGSPPPPGHTLPPPPPTSTLPPPPAETLKGDHPPQLNARADANPVYPVNANANPTDTKTNPADTKTNPADTKTNPADTKTASTNTLPPFQGEPLPTIASSKCSTGHLQCCKIAQLPTDASVTPALNSLNISPDTISGLVGVTCTTIPVIGAGIHSCSDKPLCCTDNSFGGKIALACNRVDLSL